MNWTFKIIGMIVGAVLFGPLGLMLGFLFGHLLDQRTFVLTHPQNASSVQTLFFNSTFRVMGYMAKSDGRVSENEITKARHIMAQMRLDDRMKQEAIRLFNEGKEPSFNVSEALLSLKQACARQPSLLRIFLEIQLQMASADGGLLSDEKRRAFQYICQQLGIMNFNFDPFESIFGARKHGEYQQRYQQHTHTRYSDLGDAYRTLGVSQTAQQSEIKKAYRRLMSQNHPDKLIAKGLPPEMIQVATQKTQQIKSAYERICTAKGWA